MTYKELYEAIKPFATDKVYQNDIVTVINSTPTGVFADIRGRYNHSSTLRLIAVDEDGQIEVG
jgi:hypothetical protein